MTYVVGAGEGKGLCKTWHLFLRLVCVFSGTLGNSLAVLPLPASTAGGTGSIPGQGTRSHRFCITAKKKKKICGEYRKIYTGKEISHRKKIYMQEK